MNRRRFLGVTGCVTGLAGCVNEDCHCFEEGEPFIVFRTRNNNDFSGTVRIVPSCRDEPVDIAIIDGQPESEIPYARAEDGESCSFEIYIDGDHIDSMNVSSATLGEIVFEEGGRVSVYSDYIL